MKIQTKKVIEVDEWDSLVEKTYGRTYSFQQQDGCRARGVFHLTVPAKPNDFENDSVPEKVNHEQRGVSFQSWINRDPKKPIPNQKYDFELELWWQRNFYPDVQMVANDLHSKGLLEAGDYIIEIDW